MKKKTIIITGGNAGLGLATALVFARNGANVAIIGRRAKENRMAREQIEAAGAQCLDFAGDVTDEAFLRASVNQTAETFGGLHYAFNNAGVEQVPTVLPDQTIDDYRRIIDVNVMGVWLAMREEIPLIQRSGGGCVVNTASVGGLVGMARIPLYIAAKHAVLGLTKSVALEYAKLGVRVNAVCPGAVRTDLYDRFTGKNPEMEKAIEGMHPMGRSGTPEEVASAVLYLCRDATWTTGQGIVMDGGFTTP
ncbi:MAG TPA: glucose 1-dehydrogenase [Candidatus Acidoferrum sp.]|jgi:NAD(P)-dependent dehydrogenase (short-subunit alcohol dehydrogenase family)|nr:glucose 1-dehydrogenase [Candidatus Acidoferrum sp.]